jgi:hypothetical protein
MTDTVIVDRKFAIIDRNGFSIAHISDKCASALCAARSVRGQPHTQGVPVA